MAIVGGRLVGPRPRFWWTEAHRLARIRRSAIRLEEDQAARKLFSRRCEDFFRRTVGRRALPKVRTQKLAAVINPWEGSLLKQSSSPVVTLGHVMASAKKAAARRICSPALRKEVSHFDLIPLCRSNSNISPVHLERKQYVPLIPPCVLDDFTEGSRSRVVYQPSYSVGQTPAQELSPQKETGSQRFLASATLCWASRNPGLHLLRQKVFSTPKPGNPLLSPFYHQPPFPVLKTYADVLKSAINSSDMA